MFSLSRFSISMIGSLVARQRSIHSSRLSSASQTHSHRAPASRQQLRYRTALFLPPLAKCWRWMGFERSPCLCWIQTAKAAERGWNKFCGAVPGRNLWRCWRDLWTLHNRAESTSWDESVMFSRPLTNMLVSSLHAPVCRCDPETDHKVQLRFKTVTHFFFLSKWGSWSEITHR